MDVDNGALARLNGLWGGFGNFFRFHFRGGSILFVMLNKSAYHHRVAQASQFGGFNFFKALRDIVLPQAALMDDMGLHTTTATTVNVDGVQMTPKQAAEYHRHHRGRAYPGTVQIPPPVASGMPYAAHEERDEHRLY